MKKYIIGIAITFLFIASGLASHVSAQTATSTDEGIVQVLQEQLTALLEQIKSLQTQIVELTRQQGELKRELSEVKQVLRQQLREGLSGDEVTLLQELLAGDPEIYPEGLVTGFFGPLTKNAVKRFQKKHNIEQVGEVGPITRARINELFSSGAGNFGKIPPGLAKKFNLDDDDDNGDDIDDDGDEKNGKKVGKIFSNGKVIICHIPPGNPDAGHTVNVGIPATKAHLGHGDTLGACGGDGGENGDGDDTTPPVISSLSANDITETSANINWTTDEDSDSKVWYSTSTPVSIGGSTEMVQSGNLTTNHSLGLSSLATSTTYYYIAVSTDASDNIATSSSEQFFTTADEVVEDTTPPVISGLGTSSLAATSTNIVWTTDEDSDSKVWYSTSTPLVLASSLSIESASLVTSHILGLSSLSTSTTHYFIAISSDSSGNTSTSSEQFFNTLSE